MLLPFVYLKLLLLLVVVASSPYKPCAPSVGWATEQGDAVDLPPCEFAEVSVSESAGYYALDCLGPGVPFSGVFSLPDNRPVLALDTNDDLRELVDNTALPR